MRVFAAPNRADSEGDEPAEVWPVSSPSEPSSEAESEANEASAPSTRFPFRSPFGSLLARAPLVRPPARSSSPLACQALRLCTTLTTHCVAPSRARCASGTPPYAVAPRARTPFARYAFGPGPLVAVVVHEQVNQNLRVGGEPTHQTQRHEREKRRDLTAAGAGRGGVGRVPLERGERDGGE